MGALSEIGPVELGVIASEAALADAKVPTEDFVHSIFGNVCSFSSDDGPYLSRHVALRSGLPQKVGSLTLNRLCGSGFEAIVQANQYVEEGPCLVGGAENMSLTPLIQRNSRKGFRFAQPPKLVDSLWEALTDKYVKLPMGYTAENLAKEYKISREDCDKWALQSHQRAAKAEDEKLFDHERVSIELPKVGAFKTDEHVRRESSLEKLAKLKPVFEGVTTAGNASGMNDAAAALVVANRKYAESWSQKSALKPLCRVAGSVVVGCDPKVMGIGPVAAIEKLLAELGWKMADIDYLEINEAFAAQIIAVKKALNLSDEQLNPHGSGISLGHPLGATGARISTHIAHHIQQGRAKKAIGAACIGGGQGIAVAFESV